MKTIILLLAGLSASTLVAQTKINKTLPFQNGQLIRMHFDYPELIRVSTWDKNEISIQGTVNINQGESDDAFKLETSTSGNTVSIRNEITDMNNLPRRITVDINGQKMVFRNQTEWKKYREEHGNGPVSVSNGVDMDIILEVRVPRNAETTVESVYGMVEVRDFSGPLTVTATYGGVDATVTERVTGELVAETNYGHIYSNLSTKPGSGEVRDEDFHTVVSVKPGSGPRYSYESTYGNVYLRSSKQ